MGFLGGLQLLFIGLKLTEFITWDWFTVLIPTWIALAAYFVTFGYLVYAMINDDK